jgi:hypothetical protein
VRGDTRVFTGYDDDNSGAGGSPAMAATTATTATTATLTHKIPTAPTFNRIKTNMI